MAPLRVHGRSVRRLLAVSAAIAAVALLIYGLTTPPSSRSLDEALSDGEVLPAPGFELPVLQPAERRVAMWLGGAAPQPTDECALTSCKARRS